MPRALTDEQIDILTGQYVTGIYQELEQAVINDIARRVKKTERFTETAEIMARNMREQGFNTGEIMAQVRQQLNSDPAYILEVAQNTKEYKQEVMALIKEAEAQALAEGDLLMAAAGDMAFNDDFQMWAAHDVQLKPDSTLTQLKEAFSRQTADRLRNLTQSTGMLNMNGVPLLEEYQHEVDLALVKMCSGGFSYGQAVKDCVHGMARNGLCVEYPSGRKYNLDTAARMAVRTASSQLAGRVSEMNLRKTGTALVYVSAHAGARPEHALWQGQVYVYDRTQAAKYPQYADFYASTDYGSVTGLKGVNCSHNFYPYWEGDPVPEFNEPEPVNIDGKEYSYYDATQQQRSMERGIKQTKRELEGLKAIKAPAQDIQQMTAKLSKQIKDYNRFSSAANLRAKPERYGSITTRTSNTPQKRPAAAARKYTSTDVVYKDKKVKYNQNVEYKVDMKGLTKNVNQSLSYAAELLAKLGTETRVEHMFLVNLETGRPEFYEKGNENSVGMAFWNFIKQEENKNKQFAFIHNHNIISSLSVEDLTTAAQAKNVPVMIAVQNDGVTYGVTRKGEPMKGSFFAEERYKEEIKELEDLRNSGFISRMEYGLRKEEIIIQSMIKEFYGFMEVYDGR